MGQTEALSGEFVSDAMPYASYSSPLRSHYRTIAPDWPFQTFWGQLPFSRRNNGRPATTQYPYNHQIRTPSSGGDVTSQLAFLMVSYIIIVPRALIPFYKSNYPQYNVLGEVIDDAWVAPVPGSVSCDYNGTGCCAPDHDGGETCAVCTIVWNVLPM